MAPHPILSNTSATVKIVEHLQVLNIILEILAKPSLAKPFRSHEI
jgi:hypothetical protein